MSIENNSQFTPIPPISANPLRSISPPSFTLVQDNDFGSEDIRFDSQLAEEEIRQEVEDNDFGPEVLRFDSQLAEEEIQQKVEENDADNSLYMAYDAYQSENVDEIREFLQNGSDDHGDATELDTYTLNSTFRGGVPSFEEEEDDDPLELTIGQLFSSRDNFKQYLQLYALRHNFETKPVKTIAEKIVVKCRNDECSWRCGGRKVRGTDQFRVTNLSEKHTCGPHVDRKHKQCSSKLIANEIVSQVREDEEYTPKMIITDIQKKYGYECSYWLAYKGKEKALEQIRGNFEDSFNELRPLMREIRLLDTDNDVVLKCVSGRFQRFYWSFGACKRSFRQYIPPVIGVDGCHLRGKYPGCLMMATAVDGNNHLVPLAFSIVEIEKKDTWKWFLELLRESIGYINQPPVIITDRMRGLVSKDGDVVEEVFPECYHSYCMVHLSRNLVGKTNDQIAAKLFWAAARARKEGQFQQVMNKILKDHEESYKFISEIPYERWANAYFPTKRYGMLSTNCAESMNSVMKKCRSLPICKLVEVTRKKCSEYFYKRKIASESWDTVLTPKKQEIFEKNLKASKFLGVQRHSDVEFQVEDEHSCNVVNLYNRTCTCRDWDVFGMPCRHTLVAVSSARLSPYDYCDAFFKTTNYRAAYNDTIRPMRGNEYWLRFETDEAILPPAAILQAGRRKKTRIESTDSGKLKRKCTICKKLGHNKRTCRYPPVSTID